MIEIVPAAPNEYEPALALLFDRFPFSAQQASIADVMKALGSGRIACSRPADGVASDAPWSARFFYMLQGETARPSSGRQPRLPTVPCLRPTTRCSVR